MREGKFTVAEGNTSDKWEQEKQEEEGGNVMHVILNCVFCAIFWWWSEEAGGHRSLIRNIFRGQIYELRRGILAGFGLVEEEGEEVKVGESSN